jgi:DNA-directed RNA polymerase sigma subunit (sigma70/sigma32)
MATSLSPSEALVLRLRFGLEDTQRRSEREVAELMQEPRKMIRAKTAAAFRKMRALPGARKLLESLEG